MTAYRTVSICTNGQNIKVIEQFVYSVSPISTDTGTELNIEGGINSIQPAFVILSNILKCKYTNIKLRLIRTMFSLDFCMGETVEICRHCHSKTPSFH